MSTRNPLKHPWEYKQAASHSKTSKEEFEKVLKKIKKKEESHVSDMFIKKEDESKPKTLPYRLIDGIPHKQVAGRWFPLTKM